MATRADWRDSADKSAVKGKSGEIAKFDRKILTLAADGKSPEEISAELNGVETPEQIALRIKTLLAGRANWLSIQEQKALVIIDLQETKDYIKAAIEAAGAEEGIKGLASLVNAVKEVGLRLDEMQRSSDEVVSGIRRDQAVEWVKALMLVYDAVVDRLKDMYPEVDTIILQEMVAEEIPGAVARIEDLVIDKDA